MAMDAPTISAFAAAAAAIGAFTVAGIQLYVGYRVAKGMSQGAIRCEHHIERVTEAGLPSAICAAWRSGSPGARSRRGRTPRPTNAPSSR